MNKDMERQDRQQIPPSREVRLHAARVNLENIHNGVAPVARIIEARPPADTAKIDSVTGELDPRHQDIQAARAKVAAEFPTESVPIPTDLHNHSLPQ